MIFVGGMFNININVNINDNDNFKIQYKKNT
jgi:hypothetical protein